MSAALPIEAIRHAFLNMDEFVIKRMKHLLHTEEVDQLIAFVVEAQIAVGWTLLPPEFASRLPSQVLRDELARIDAGQGAHQQ